MFRVGMKVVCVDASVSFGCSWIDADTPVAGAIYTITGVVIELDPLAGDVPALQLAEIKNNKTWRGAYAARRFRPTVERKTDISFAHEILRKVTRKGRVSA